MTIKKYYIKSYTKEDQGFLGAINSIDHTYGEIHEPYKIILNTVAFWGLLEYETVFETTFPRGFNHKRELSVGRRFIL